MPLFAKTRKKQVILLLSAIAFILPLILFGKVIYSRYILPSSFFFISSAAISINNLNNKFLKQSFVAILAITGLIFIKNAYFNIDNLQLSKADRVQYLEEWSSGHGITETVKYIEELAKTKKVAVATEGYFGTLPDGILLNFHNKNVENIYVEGIGQPIIDIPDKFWQKAKDFELKLLVVNSHRLKMILPNSQLLKSFCRPNNAPCLQVWEIKQQ